MASIAPMVDLWDPGVFDEGPPHAYFDYLRTEDPVHWNRRSDDTGFWVLTRFADTIVVSRDTTTYTSSHGFSDMLEDPAHTRAFAENIMYRDPPAHTAHRAPLSRMFTRAAMGRIEDRVRDIVRDVLACLPSDGAFDWVRLVAAEIPSRVVSDILGVPIEDHQRLVEWANDIFGRDGTPEAEQRFGAAVQGILAYVGPFKAQRRAAPDSGVMSVLLGTEVDGAKLSEATIDQWFLALSQAGFETTHTLIAQGTHMLLEDDGLVDQLTSPESIASATEEMLRYITPVTFMGRVATTDTELCGQEIRAGDYVTMYYAAANRDPLAFPDPHVVDLRRRPNNHQAFGAPGSPHHCLGAHLARLEMRILLEELMLEKFPYRQVAPAERKRGVFMNGLARLPVTRAGK